MLLPDCICILLELRGIEYHLESTATSSSVSPGLITKSWQYMVYTAQIVTTLVDFIMTTNCEENRLVPRLHEMRQLTHV